MIVRDFVTFDAEFPEDDEWDDEGNLLVPGGKAIAVVIRDQLNQRNFSCTEVVQHSFYGWSFHTRCESMTIWCVLSAPDDGWLLQIVPPITSMRRLLGSNEKAVFECFQDRIHAVLSADNRFSHVFWHTRSDYEAGMKNLSIPMPR